MNAGGKLQRGAGQHVYVPFGVPLDGGEDPHRLGAEDVAPGEQGIDADVEQPAAAHLPLVADVVGVVEVVAEPALDRPQPTDATRAHKLSHPLPLRVVDHDIGLLNLQAGLVTDGDQGGRLRRVERDRLLAKHVLAGARRLRRPRHVEMVRQRVVDHVDGGIGQHGLVVAVCPGQAELFGHRLRLGQLAARDAVDTHAGGLLQRRDHVLDGKVRGAEHPPRERRHRILP